MHGPSEDDPPSPAHRLVLAILISSIEKHATSLTVVAERSDAAEWECHVWFEVHEQWEREMQPPAKLHRAIVEELTGLAGLTPALGEVTGHFGMHTSDGGEHHFEIAVTTRPDAPPMVAIRRLASSVG